MSTMQQEQVQQAGLILTNQENPTPNAQSAPVEVVPPVKQIVVKNAFSAPLEEYGLVQPDGSFNLSHLEIGQRLHVFEEFKSKANMNMPLLDVMVASPMAPGVRLIPMAIMPDAADLWDGDAAKKMKLPEGHVEPSADFMIKLGRLLGVKLTKVFAGLEKIDNAQMYSVRYLATIQLPNGEFVSEEGGKMQALNNANGIQAHIAENTEKKAKRNAIKALLGIPTSMPEQVAKRGWLVCRCDFSRCESPEVTAAIARAAEEAKALLYAPKKPQPQPEISRNEMDAYIARIAATATLEALQAIRLELKGKNLPSGQSIELGAHYKTQKAKLEAAATNQVATPAPVEPADEGVL